MSRTFSKRFLAGLVHCLVNVRWKNGKESDFDSAFDCRDCLVRR